MFQEVFYFTQIWTCYEFNFTTGRGWISIVSLILSFVSMTSVILAFVKERIYVCVVISWQHFSNSLFLQMRDYCFTLALGHFIVVSIVMLDFPYNGAWWFGMGLGLPLVIIPSEFICYQMELMPYKSHLGGKDKKSPSANSNNNKEQSQQQKQQKKPHQQPIPPLPIQQLKPDSLAEPIIQQSFGNGTISLEDIALEDAADAVPRSSPTTSLVRTPRTPPPQNSSPRSSPRLQHRRSSSISYHQHQQLH